ncbi:cell division protein FtsA [Clostridium gasigenes]|uniref:cell division protein FtsA n=1 Tax=Clostridium gasigenes TaxID=94869 RepID=UPI001C0C7D2D|nr:cell division protein FtsA [Clostridium gasigenes]MBU3103690.1 cell division protein FtsA [Clostridium gasigenes]MBU3136727.1 cell division protein FtsA [Clostridium gasigenes]
MNNNDMKFALDIGTRSMIGTLGVVKEDKFEVICEKYLEHEERAMIDGQIHDIDLVAKGVNIILKQVEEEVGFKVDQVSIAAAGRFLKTINSKGTMDLNIEEEITKDIIRSLELTAVKKAEEKINRTTNGKLYCVGYSVTNYYLNGFVISNLIGHKGESVGVEVIATFLPRSVVDSLYTVMKKVGLRVNNLTLEPIAAIEAVVPKKLRLLNIALIDIGAGTSDIAISSNETISSFGMVPQAGDKVTEAIAQEYLVDFNTAENMKRRIGIDEEITYTDVLGFENSIKSENIKKTIEAVVKKIAQSIGSKVKELNGNKPPSAIFLVGGGAHTPGLIEQISEVVNLPLQRIAIKDRTAVIDCISNNGLGSAGVTVLGIALVALKNAGNDFIDIILNGSPISMFNSHEHTIMDVLLQAGINPSMLIAKKGKNIRYTLNKNKRIAFGEKGENPVIELNKTLAALDYKVKEGAKINIIFAKNGKDAKPKVMEQIKEFMSISIYINDEIINIEPKAFINNKSVKLDEFIKNDDVVKIIMPKTIGDIKKYILNKETSLYKSGICLEKEYKLIDGERLTTSKDVITTINPKISIDKDRDNYLDIVVTVNSEKVILTGKQEYIFVDIFNFIDFDLKSANGTINLKLNEENASYTDKIKNQDIIKVFWSN